MNTRDLNSTRFDRVHLNTELMQQVSEIRLNYPELVPSVAPHVERTAYPTGQVHDKPQIDVGLYELCMMVRSGELPRNTEPLKYKGDCTPMGVRRVEC